MFYPWTIDAYFGRVGCSSHTNCVWTSLNMNASVTNAKCVFAGFLRLEVEREGSILVIVELLWTTEKVELRYFLSTHKMVVHFIIE